MSDVHCPINLFLHADSVLFNEAENMSTSPFFQSKSERESNYVSFQWSREKGQIFKESITASAVKLDRSLELIKGNLNQVNLDTFSSELCTVFMDSAKEVGACKVKECSRNKHRKSNINENNPLFDSECKSVRLEYMQVKNRIKRVKKSQSSPINIELEKKYDETSKLYKKLLRGKKRKYNRELHARSHTLKDSDPKEYWKILNEDNKKVLHSAKIPINEFVEHFSQLGNVQQNTNESQENHYWDNTDIAELCLDDALNADISVEEVILMIKKLKNNKACGKDLIRNEFLKNCPVSLLDIIFKLFNLILKSGLVPTDWSVGLIVPIFKKKGKDTDPDNYRGITLLSCLGKLFTSILNKRISQFLQNDRLLGEEQAGFRAGYSTSDHIFVMKALIDIYLQKKKRLYCAFIDYKKAFDLVDRTALWCKMLKSGIKENF